jgi:hypothetical protein
MLWPERNFDPESKLTFYFMLASPAGYGRLWTGDVHRRILLAT